MSLFFFAVWKIFFKSKETWEFFLHSLEQFSYGFYETQAEVVDNKRNEPISAQSGNMQLVLSAGNRMCKSIHNWLLFVLLLIGWVKRRFVLTDTPSETSSR